MDNDGLLQAGHEGVQLTWMDAKIGEWVVTPRTGKPVEINALWFNALCVMCELAKVLKEPKDAGTYALLAERTKNSFIREFWNDEKKYLYDLIDASGKSEEIRPNQIFAVSLPFEILEREKQKQVVAVVEKELLTPRGLRSLDTSDPHYIGVYAGDPYDRDSAYHQGTIWPWLMGPYLESYMKVNDYSPAALAYCRTIIEEFRMELKDRGIGTISEIFDGDEPHLPKGCISQAWSVAEILRILEILEKRGHA
jgi:predicted glycogen debranching enzyme